MSRIAKFLWALVLLLLPLTALALPQIEGTTNHYAEKNGVTIKIGKNIYGAGGLILSTNGAAGDAYLAGGQVSVQGDTAEDLVVVGGDIVVTGNVGGDLRVAGSGVTIAGEVTGNLIVMGGQIKVLPTAVIRGEVVLAGGTVDFAGEATGDLFIMAKSLSFTGKVGGDAKMTAEKMLVGTPASIGGTLIYSTKNKLKLPVGLAKSVEHRPWDSSGGSFDSRWQSNGVLLGMKIFFTIIIAVTGVVLIALGRNHVVHAIKLVKKRYWAALGFGILFLIIPFLAILLAITMVGVILAGIVMLLWVAGLIIIKVMSAALVGAFIIKVDENAKYLRRLASFFVGLVALFGLGFIPEFGWMVNLTIFILTAGGLMLAKIDVYKALKKAKLV